jgi:hypothetical protein
LFIRSHLDHRSAQFARQYLKKADKAKPSLTGFAHFAQAQNTITADAATVFVIRHSISPSRVAAAAPGKIPDG